MYRLIQAITKSSEKEIVLIFQVRRRLSSWLAERFWTFGNGSFKVLKKDPSLSFGRLEKNVESPVMV
jgi:hypothetical protein